MNVPADTQTTSRPFPWLLALALFLFLYIVPAWPALIHAWWYSDDLCALEQGWRTLVPHCLENGRPVQSLWYALFLLEQGPGASAVNCGFRFLQVGLHAAAAICIVRVIWQQVPSWAAFAGVLPFLLWGFSPEAVLWRGAGMYTLAACLAAAGLLLIRLQAV